ncbi:MAG TPA: CBS domain-containing protein [Ramlibacter sp.]|uniref:CBS domain-containing protein n=1 Tax=Ramlibacter sp. TaxID=1917967 RepID=UPI002D7F9618|nr:CBS domain-containing protein [Ramlibacter sp.]HET8746746.1 CBS domain-containing protein [Ramlibacter sp.]
MDARDLMTSPVVCVARHTPVLQVAALLREQRIGGVPVLEEGRLVGIVTEKDLLHRRELGTELRSHRQIWWRRVVAPSQGPQWYIKSHGRRAEHVMTRQIVAVRPETPVREIMQLFDTHRIGRVPVLEDERVVGIVTCADLVKALAQGRWVDTGPQAELGDEAIRARLLSELNAQDWWNSGFCAVDVEDGVVRFKGFVETEWERRASCVAAQNVPGVRRVEDERQPTAELPSLL